MKNARKNIGAHEIGGDARRQYMDALSTFSEWERSVKESAEVRGGMYWKRQGKTDYLIRTSPSNSQKSLGPRSPETEAVYGKFTERKTRSAKRVKNLVAQLGVHKRMNRALFVGRAPQMLVDILAMIDRAGIEEHFTVVGTHALYAYEAAAGVRIEPGDALATRDIDLLWDTRKRIQFSITMEAAGYSMIGLLRKVDPTFRLRRDQLYTAINDKGFEVDIIRRETAEGDPHPLRITDAEDDFWVTQAERAAVLLNAPRLSAMIVSPSGDMARMTTISPIAFSQFKRWLAAQPTRDPMKRARDTMQADVVEQIVAEYLPHL
jgi:hypothetical protein